jgi:hypothetical protein
MFPAIFIQLGNLASNFNRFNLETSIGRVRWCVRADGWRGKSGRPNAHGKKMPPAAD